MPISALSDSVKVCRQLSISRGVEPLYLDAEGMDMLDEEAPSFSMCSVVCTRTDLLGPEDVAVCVIDDSITVETIHPDLFFDGEGDEK